jgi:hypothetical protein
MVRRQVILMEIHLFLQRQVRRIFLTPIILLAMVRLKVVLPMRLSMQLPREVK